MTDVKLLLSRSNTWNTFNCLQTNHIYLIYMYKEDLALNNLQLLICHQTQLYQIIYI